MPAVDEVMTIVRGMTDEERDELFRLLEELDEQKWRRERAEATRAFHQAGLTDDDIDEAVRKLRYESPSSSPAPGATAELIRAWPSRVPLASEPRYNGPMKNLDNSVLEQLLDPVGRLLTPEVARKLVHHRFDPRAQAHVDRLARKCNEGRLTDDERREYETYVHAIDFLAILQAKARALLRQSDARR